MTGRPTALSGAPDAERPVALDVAAVPAAAVADDAAAFHRVLAVVAIVLAAGSLAALRAVDVRLQAGQLVPAAGVLALLLGGAAFYRRRRPDPRAVQLFLFAFWGILFSNLHTLPMFVAARIDAPMRDALLARMDAALGLEVPAVRAAMQAVPVLDRLLARAYGTLMVLVAAATVVPPLAGRLRPAKEYAVACIVAGAVGIPLFAGMQAVGPWTHYGYAPLFDQRRYMAVYAALKEPGPFVLDLGYGDGLICFPSFHTILAVLAATALWPFAWLRWPAAGLAAAIVVSTVTTGTHYVVDVVSGLVVAAVAIATARAFTRRADASRDPVARREGA